MLSVSLVVPGGSNGAGGTPGEGFEGTVGSYLQQHQAQLALQQQSQLQQLQQLHHYQQQILQYQQQQVSRSCTRTDYSYYSDVKMHKSTQAGRSAAAASHIILLYIIIIITCESVSAATQTLDRQQEFTCSMCDENL